MGCNHDCQETILTIANAMAGGFTAVTWLISLIQIFKHLLNFTNPWFQSKIIVIIFMAPFYALTSFLKILTYDTKGFFALIRDLYEAVLIYAFFNLLALYLAYNPDTKEIEYERIYEALATKGVRKHMLPMNWVFRRPLILISNIRGQWFYRTARLYILQFLVVKPLVTFILIIIYIFDEDSPVALFFKGIVFISVSLSVYYLVLFYDVLKKELAFTRPLLKFLSVKGVLFFTFWQDFVFDIFKPQILSHFDGLTPENEKFFIETCECILVCFEMIILSIMTTIAFSHKDFKETDTHFKFRKDEVKDLTKKLINDVISDNFVEVIEDLKELKEPLKDPFREFEDQEIIEDKIMTISTKKKQGLVSGDILRQFRVVIREKPNIIPNFIAIELEEEVKTNKSPNLNSFTEVSHKRET